ncbi:MAG: hypothetical protein QOJ99_4508 [Bryobacterales bacterium]|jgi:hypothetical protein|nr:hypothetical protein [Bryobacterales bacterium]
MENAPPVLACNLNAVTEDRRPRYTTLMKRLRSAVYDPDELPDGYAWRLHSDAMSLPEVAEWITIERLCCPFLIFNLEVSGDSETCLTLRGPSGVKDILREEFLRDTQPT